MKKMDEGKENSALSNRLCLMPKYAGYYYTPEGRFYLAPTLVKAKKRSGSVLAGLLAFGLMVLSVFSVQKVEGIPLAVKNMVTSEQG